MGKLIFIRSVKFETFQCFGILAVIFRLFSIHLKVSSQIPVAVTLPATGCDGALARSRPSADTTAMTAAKLRRPQSPKHPKIPPHLQRCTANSVQNHPTNTSIPASHTINAPIFAIFYFYFYIRCIHHHRPRHRQETLQNRSRRNSPPLAHHSFSRIKKKPAHTLLCDCIGVRSQQPHSQKKKLQLVQGQGYILAK